MNDYLNHPLNDGGSNDESLNEHLFDMLADGELSDEARQELLSRLDRESDGWRRCALAFLEAQAWRGSARSMVREATDPVAEKKLEPAESTKVQPSRKSATWLNLSAGTIWAMAASFLVAFLLGVGFRGGWGRSEAARQPGVNEIAKEPVKAPKQETNVASAGVVPDNMKLLVRGGAPGTNEKIELPVFEAGNLDPFWLENRPSPMPEDLVRQLEQLGHQVKQQRRMMQVNLDDGRKMIVPVDQVEVVPVKWQ